MLICSDPALAMAKTELNDSVLGLVARLNEDDAKAALAEYERWSRVRDRKCDLVGKDNVPLDELSSSEACLSDYFSEKTAEVAAAKGDPGGFLASMRFPHRPMPTRSICASRRSIPPMPARISSPSAGCSRSTTRWQNKPRW